MVEFDGIDAGLELEAEETVEFCKAAGAREVRRAKSGEERIALWKGRKKAFGAMGRLAPDLLPTIGYPLAKEFQYRRHGTTDIMAFLEPSTGDVFCRCTENHNTQTLSRVFTEHVELQPEHASLHYICDNLNTHFNDDF